MTPFRPPPLEVEELLDVRIQALPHPSRYFRAAVHRFLSFLQTDFPQLRQLSELRRDPHLLGWLRCLSQEDPPLSHSTRRIYLIGLRRLLHELASEGSSIQSGLILSMVVVGGMGTTAGPVVGALLLTALPQAITFLNLPTSVMAPLQGMLYTGLVLVFIFLKPSGLMARKVRE